MHVSKQALALKQEKLAGEDSTREEKNSHINIHMFQNRR